MSGPWGFSWGTFWLIILTIVFGVIPLIMYLYDLSKKT